MRCTRCGEHPTVFATRADIFEPEGGPRLHKLKVHPQFYQKIEERLKNFEIRYNDRDFRVGDLLKLEEYDPDTQCYSGRSVLVNINYITDFEQKPGYVVMGFAQVPVLGDDS